MRGNVTADQGEITNGVFSSIGIGPASGTPSIIRARNGINNLDAPTILAEVDARYNGGSGGVRTLLASAGNFSGSLQAASIGGGGVVGLSVAGVLSATVNVSGNVDRSFSVTGATTGAVTLGGTVSQPVALNGGASSGGLTIGTLTSSLTIAGSPGVDLSIGSVGSTGSVNIGGALAAGRLISIAGSLAGSINLPTSGLAGQVLINTADSGGDWLSTGRVRLGAGGSQFTLTQADYGVDSSSVGGGSVGVVRYNLNFEDGAPAGGRDEPGAPLVKMNSVLAIDPGSLLLRWYGPIQPGTGDPLVVKVRTHTGAWVDFTTAFTVTVNPSGVAAPERTLRIAPATGVVLPLGLYEVTPGAGAPRCAGTSAVTPPEVAPFTYYFRVYPDCDGSGTPNSTYENTAADPADCNTNGTLDCTELTLSNDHNQDGRFDNCVPCDLAADWDGNGEIEPADVSAFMNQWFFDVSDVEPPISTVADFDHDSDVDPADVAMFVGVWFAQLSAGC